LPDATLSGGACRNAGLSGAPCSACKLTPSSPGPGTAATPLKAAVVPAGARAGRPAPLALTGRRIAIGDTPAGRCIVVPGVSGDGGAIDAVEPRGIDRHVAAAPIGTAPAPERPGDGDAGANGEASRKTSSDAVADRRREGVGRIARIGPGSVGSGGGGGGDGDDLRGRRGGRGHPGLGPPRPGGRLPRPRRPRAPAPAPPRGPPA